MQRGGPWEGQNIADPDRPALLAQHNYDRFPQKETKVETAVWGRDEFLRACSALVGS